MRKLNTMDEYNIMNMTALQPGNGHIPPDKAPGQNPFPENSYPGQKLNRSNLP